MRIISLPTSLASGVVLVANVGALPSAASVPIGSIRVTEDTGTLYVSDGTTWNSAGGGGSGVDSVNGLTGVVTIQVGDGSIGSTGTSVMVYSNSSSELDNLPGWGISPDFGLSVGVTQNVIDDGYHNWNYLELVLDPSITAGSATWAHTSSSVTIDPDSSGFAIGTDGAAVIVHGMNVSHQGTSNTGSIQFLNMNAQIGNGADAIDVSGLIGPSIFPAISDLVTITQGITGFSFAMSSEAGVVYNNSGITGYNDNSNILSAVRGYTSINLSPTLAEIQNNSNYTGVNVNPTVTDLTGNASVNMLALAGTFTNMSATGGINAINISPTITHLTQNAYGINIAPTTTDGDADWYAINISSNSINTTGQIRGIEVTVPQNLTSIGLTVSGHTNLSSEFPLVSGQGQQYGHVIGGQIIVPNATTITGTDVLANNMAFTVNTGDATSDWTAASVVGLTTLGFVGQIVGDGTLNGDVNFCLNGYSDAHNGHIDRVINFHAAAVPGGATGTMDEAVLFFGQMPFGLPATDNWGLRIETAELENFLPKLVIGTSTSKKVASASVALEIDSTTGAVLMPRMTTTQKNTLTPIAGMQVYDSTVNMMSYYNGSAWVNF